MTLRFAFCVLLLLSFTCAAQQSDDWWFDVEVIVFDRISNQDQVKERFPQNADLGPQTADWDLLSGFYQPELSFLLQSLPQCNPKPIRYIEPTSLDELIPLDISALETSDPPEEEKEFSNIEQWLYFNNIDLSSAQIENIIPAISFPTGCFEEQIDYDTSLHSVPVSTPPIVSGASRDHTWGAHLLNEETFELSEVSDRIAKEKGLTRLLHIAWRQPVAFEEQNAKSMRLYAGANFANINNNEYQNLQDDLSGAEQNSEGNMLDEIATDFETAFNNFSLEDIKRKIKERTNADNGDSENSTHEKVWQIDGSMKVFLQYVGRVPYLHIDSNLLYRKLMKPSADPTSWGINSVEFKQRRRVISKQLHYFDHPLFGMLVQIRRYRVP